MFEAELDAFKNSVGNSIFDTVTGAIKTGLNNSGVEIKTSVVPQGASDKKEPSPSALPAYVNIALGVGAVVIGFMLFKKLKKGRV